MARLLSSSFWAAAFFMATIVLTSVSAEQKAIRNWETRRCLDSNSNGQVYTLPCNGGLNQRWEWLWPGSNIGPLRNVGTGLCLDTNGGPVYTLPCNGHAWQTWSPELNKWISSPFRRCIDGNAAGEVYTSVCNTNHNMHWDWI